MSASSASADPRLHGAILDELLAAVHGLAARRGDFLAVRQVEQLRDRLHGVTPAPAPTPPPAPTSELHCSHIDGSMSNGAGGPAPVAPPAIVVHVAATGPSYADVAETMRKREAARVAAESTDTTERDRT